MKIKSIVLSLFCLSALALGAELMSQQDLQATWFKDNPNYKVEFSAEKCTAACLKNERRALAVQSRSITGVKPGETFKVSFLARVTVNNLEFFPQRTVVTNKVFSGFSMTGIVMKQPLQFPKTARHSAV